MTHRKRTTRIYRDKKKQQKLTPGHKKIIRLRAGIAPKARKSAGALKDPAEFVIFSIKRILTSGNLVTKVGRQWKVRISIPGAEPGESFTSLDTCADSVATAIENEYARMSKRSVAA